MALLPIGSFEQHGAHLPLATDTVVACAVAERVAAAYDLFLLPPVTISCSHEHSSWPGTVSISHTTLTAVITDVLASLRGSGIERLALVSGHGGNYVLSQLYRPRLRLSATFSWGATWDVPCSFTERVRHVRPVGASAWRVRGSQCGGWGFPCSGDQAW